MENDQFRRITQCRETTRKEAAQRYALQSKERMKKNMETKIRTTMIGALSVIEDKLGFLWGQGKPRSQLTDQELEMESIKEELRTEILNNGNNQIRAAVAEINQYDITWNRYRYNSEFKDKD
jgi:hypothetical protein